MTDTLARDSTSGSAYVAEPEAGAVPASRREGVVAERQKRKPRRMARTVLSLVFSLLCLLILWPAQYGGVTGLTVVNGHSMERTYFTGDLIVSIKKPSYQVGDVVSYMVPQGQDGAGGRVIHRIFAITVVDGATVYSTKGDNNSSVDPWTFGRSDIMGAALFSIPKVGSVLGGVSNPLILGLLSGVLVASIIWKTAPSPKRSADADPEDSQSSTKRSRRRSRRP